MEEKQKELELIFDMTSHPGWKYLIEDLEKRVEAMKEGLVNNESSTYQLGLAQGHVKVYRELISLRALLDQHLNVKDDDVEADSV